MRGCPVSVWRVGSVSTATAVVVSPIMGSTQEGAARVVGLRMAMPNRTYSRSISLNFVKKSLTAIVSRWSEVNIDSAASSWPGTPFLTTNLCPPDPMEIIRAKPFFFFGSSTEGATEFLFFFGSAVGVATLLPHPMVSPKWKPLAFYRRLQKATKLLFRKEMAKPVE